MVDGSACIALVHLCCLALGQLGFRYQDIDCFDAPRHAAEGDVQASNPAFQAQSPDSQRDLAAALAASLEEYNKNSEEDKN